MPDYAFSVGANSEALGDISFIDQIFQPDALGAYSGSIAEVNVWTPMYFSKPGKYIWINQNDPGTGIIGEICFNQTIGNVTQPLAPGSIQLNKQTNTLVFPDGLSWNEIFQSPTLPIPVPPSVNIEDAKRQTLNWREFLAGIPSIDQIRAYYIPLDDIERIIHNPNNQSVTDCPVSGIRAYFALNQPLVQQAKNGAPANEVDITSANPYIHLFVVAVDANGNDIINDTIGAGDGGALVSKTGTADSLIYDTTMPCPPLCAGASVLNP